MKGLFELTVSEGSYHGHVVLHTLATMVEETCGREELFSLWHEGSRERVNT